MIKYGLPYLLKEDEWQPIVEDKIFIKIQCLETE